MVRPVCRKHHAWHAVLWSCVRRPSCEHGESIASRGGVDVLDHSVYWLLPNGETTCCSARQLFQDRHRLGLQPDTKDDYVAVGNALGFTFLGGRCDVTELLADPGTLQEQRWSQLPWEVPNSSMDACWWLTNMPMGVVGDIVDMSTPPKFLCRSLAHLRVELHQSCVATIAKLRLERSHRQSLNTIAAERLRVNPY